MIRAVLVALLVIAWAPVTAHARQVSQPKYKIIVDKDVRIPLRDGGYLSADVYRPDAPGERFPILMSLSAYQKELQFLPHEGQFPHQERPEPEWWVPRGYTLIFVDTRGTGRSPGLPDIRIDVMPSDGGHYFSSYHLKNNSIYTGEDRASYVLLPIVPAKSGTQLTSLGGIKVGGGE